MRAIRRAAGALLAVLLGGCTMRQMIYPAPPLAVGPPPPPLEEVWWRAPAEPAIHGWEHRAAPRRRTSVLFFHGNGENLETMRRVGLIDEMVALEIDFALLDYPGYGRSEGRPSEAAVLAAAERAFAWLRESRPEGLRVVAGWSLGAAVAVQLAARHPDAVDGLIALSAWASLPEVAGSHFPSWMVRLLLSERYDSLSAAAAVRCPSLLLHGARDRIVPVRQGERLATALAPRSRWIAFPASGHNDLLAEPGVWREMARFLAALEGGGTEGL